MSTAHILLSSCVFAASARPPHTSVGMLLRVLGAGLSLLRPQGARLSVAGRPGVLSERTNIFYKGHMNESAKGGTEIAAKAISTHLELNPTWAAL